jgi:SecD/SecF fusion protein
MYTQFINNLFKRCSLHAAFRIENILFSIVFIIPLSSFAITDDYQFENNATYQNTYSSVDTSQRNDSIPYLKITLQFSIEDYILYLAEHNDPNLIEVLEIAHKKQLAGSENFIDDFTNAFQRIFPDDSLSSIFNSMLNFHGYGNTNARIVQIIKEKTTEAFDETMAVFRKRLINYGISDFAIQQGSKYQIIITISKREEINRLYDLLQNNGRLELWETFSKGEIRQYLDEVNQMEEEFKSITSSNSNASSLFSVLTPNSPSNDHSNQSIVIGSANVKDIDLINRFLNTNSVKSVMPRNMIFAWSAYPDTNNRYQLVALKVTTRDGKSNLAGEIINNCNLLYHPNKIEIVLTDQATKIWSWMTRNNMGKKIAVVLGNKLISTLTIQNQITDGYFIIEGDFSKENCADIVNLINSKNLPDGVVINVLTD